MLFRRFLTVIDHFTSVDVLAGKEKALARLNPEKFYLENVRSILGVSHSIAKRICDTAVRQRFFSRHVEVLCPDGSVAASAETELTLPEVVTCWIEENGQLREQKFLTSALEKSTFYRLNEESTSDLYRPAT